MFDDLNINPPFCINLDSPIPTGIVNNMSIYVISRVGPKLRFKK